MNHSKIPLVSICCQTYNHVNYIKEAVESFLMQNVNFSYEILLRDDASTDGTAEICKEYANSYPDKINLLAYNENQWKKGVKPFSDNVKRAKGKYIAMCEGDDYWTDPLKLQKQVDFLEGNKSFSLCFHNAKVIYELGQESHVFKELQTREYSGNEVLDTWTIPTASVLFRRKNLNIENLTNPNYLYGDIILFLTLAETGKLFCMNEIMSVYRRHEGGITTREKKSLIRAKNFIIHHLEIKNNFNGKYKKTEENILSEAYMGLSKMELINLKFNFIYSLKLAYKQNPKSFNRNFKKIYLKI